MKAMTAIERVSTTRVRAWPLAATAAILTIAIALPLAAVLNIWQDEAYTLHSTSFGPARAFIEALRFEQSAPLYFMIVAALRSISSAVWFLRGFSIVCAAFAAALVPSLARRYAPLVRPELITLAFVWNPFLIWAALEMRPYAMIVAVSATLLRLFYDAFLAERPRAPAFIAYAALVVVAMYTQYYLAFLIAAQGFAVLLYRRERFGRFLLCAAGGMLLFLPMLAIVPAQVANFRGAFAPPSFVLSIASIALAIMHYILPLGIPFANVLYGLVVATMLGLAIVAREKFRGRAAALVAIVVVAAALFACATYGAHVLVLSRHVASLYAAGVIGVYALFSLLDKRRATIAVTAWFVLTFTASSITIAATYAQLAKPGDWIRVNAYLGARERAGQPIAIFEAENAPPFSYYYRGPNTVVAIPHAVNFRRYDLSRFVVTGPKQLAATLPHAKQFWLITTGDCKSANIQFGCGTIERFVSANYVILSDAQFYKSRVRLLERR